MENIKVTVYLSTYNQEPYLRQALDSILMQKCDFRYELLIADDCSTDGTQTIALEYQKKYPDVITTYFTPVNVGGCKKLTNCIDMGLFRGDYLAYLEGDDYWLGEDRLQTLVDFLDAHPEYSRVSHKRLVINEKDEELGYDVSPAIVDRVFTIEDFLAGRSYSDFGSVFRNYFREVGSRYHSILLASRNVCDFQDMFITQDFGPVYVMDRCFGVYRSRSVAGETNYNSIMSTERKCIDKIRIARAVEDFYGGKYDLSARVLRELRILFRQACDVSSEERLGTAREQTDPKTADKLLTECLYLAHREKNHAKADFVRAHLSTKSRILAPFALLRIGLERTSKKLRHIPYEDKRRGRINPEFGE